MSATGERSGNTESRDRPAARSGMSAVLVPLIIGGALVAAAVILWDTHKAKVRLAESALIEEETRVDLRKAYRELRAGRPQEALGSTALAAEKIKRLSIIWPTDYSDLRMALLLIEGEADFLADRQDRAAQSEAKFGEALSLMTRASGDAWEFGMAGRARARLDQKKYREAADDLTLLLERNPSFGTAYYYRSKARAGLGDAAGAAMDAKRAKELDSWPPRRE